MRINIKLMLEFKEFISHHDIDLKLLKETWYIGDRRPSKVTGYTLFKNRERGRKAMYHKTDLHVIATGTTTISIPKPEHLTINLNNKVTIVAAYINTNNKLDEDELDEQLSAQDKNTAQLYNYLDKNDILRYHTDEPTRYGHDRIEPSTIGLAIAKGSLIII